MVRRIRLFLFFLLIVLRATAQVDNCSDALRTYTEITVSTQQALEERLESMVYNKHFIDEKKNAVTSIKVIIPSNPPVPLDLKNDQRSVRQQISEALTRYAQTYNYNFNQSITYRFLPNDAYQSFNECMRDKNKNKDLAIEMATAITGRQVTLSVRVRENAKSARITQCTVLQGGQTRDVTSQLSTRTLRGAKRASYTYTLGSAEDEIVMVVLTDKYPPATYYRASTKEVCPQRTHDYALLLDNVAYASIAGTGGAGEAASVWERTGLTPDLEIYRLTGGGYYLIARRGSNRLHQTLALIKNRGLSARIIDLNCNKNDYDWLAHPSNYTPPNGLYFGTRFFQSLKKDQTLPETFTECTPCQP